MADWSMFGPQSGAVQVGMRDMGMLQQLQSGQMRVAQQKQIMQDEQKLRADAQALPQNLTTLQRLSRLGDDALKGGDIAGASQMLGLAGKIQDQQGVAALRSAQASEVRYKQQMDHLDMVAHLLETSTDQASWDRNNRLVSAIFGGVSPFANTPYDPNFVSHLQGLLLKDKDRLQLQMQQERLGIYKQTADARSGYYDAQEKLAQAKLDALKNPLGAKTGSIIGASNQDVKNAEDLLQREIPGWEAKPDPNKPGKTLPLGPIGQAKALELANEANRRVKMGYAQTKEEGLQQAYEAAKNAGDFKDVQVPSGVKFGVDRKGLEIGQGTKSETQVRLSGDRPGGMNNPSQLPDDESGLKDGEYYSGPDGKVYKAKGKRLFLIPGLKSGGNAWAKEGDWNE